MKSRLCLLVGVVVLTVLIFGCGGKREGQTAQTPPATGGIGDFEAGKKIYETHCIACHGTEGKGDGPAGKALNPPPQDLTDRKAMNAFSDEQLKEIIVKGKGAMPSWSATLKDEDIRNVLRYLRGFAPMT